jgi:membrane fusion protein, heavy metal efflux system
MNRRLLACPVLFTGLLAACSGSPTPADTAGAKPAGAPKDTIALSLAEQSAGEIRTQPVADTATPPLLRVSGRIVRADDHTWHVGVRTVGVVASVSAALGARVAKGDVLARYHADEARELRAQYSRADAEVRAAGGALDLTQRTAERYRTLLSLKAASVQQTDQAAQDVVMAQTRVRDAQIELDRVREALEHDLQVPVPSAASGDPGLDDQVPILAPASGYVLEKHVTAGTTVELSTDAFVIGDLSTVWMLAAVPQEHVGELRLGESVAVSVPGLTGDSFSGTITNLGQELEAGTRALPVRVTLTNPRLVLRPEMLATADLPVGTPTARLLVPSDAIQQINGQDIVFVKSATDRFTVRPVRLGTTSAGLTPVLEGLKAGEEIVVAGSFVLKSHLLRASIEGE